MTGKAYLVGAGPGDPGLLTLRGRHLLERAEVLIHDAPCASALLAMAPEQAERIPLGRGRDGARLEQAEINALLIDRVRDGRQVVRLKAGDPFVFGRGGEEALALAEAGLEFEVVPGIPAAVGAAAFAGIPFTHRGLASAATFAILQSGAGPSDWGLDLDRLARAEGTLVLHLDPARLPALAGELMGRGLAADTPVAVIESATCPGQRVYAGTLADIGRRAAAARRPALALVGRAVLLRDRLAWAERRPLHGRTVVVTRPQGQSEQLAERLEQLGAEVLVLPCIKLAPPESWEPLDRALASLENYDWAVFTSPNGVEKFVERLHAIGRDARALAGVRLAAVGATTAAALRAANLIADAVPDRFVAEALAEALAATGVAGKRLLLVRAAEGREVLPETLRGLGADVEVVAAYRTLAASPDPAPVRLLAAEGRLSAVLFASPSAVCGFAGLFAPGEAVALLGGALVAAIGPVTAEALEAIGARADVQPTASTASALVEVLVAHLGNRGLDATPSGAWNPTHGKEGFP